MTMSTENNSAAPVMTYNKDGKRSIASLRKIVDADNRLSVTREGGSWIIKNLIDRAWHCSPQPHWTTERDALETAIGCF